MSLYYVLDFFNDPQVEPDVLVWGRWMEFANRSIANTQVSKDIRVSTVFLGLDHSFVPDAVPVLFETMVFGGPLDQEMERYTTREAALVGHKDMVKRVEDADTT